jgi:hypothetical protein
MNSLSFYIIWRKDDKEATLYDIKDALGNWRPAKNLTFLNSERMDYYPFVSFGNKISLRANAMH